MDKTAAHVSFKLYQKVMNPAQKILTSNKSYGS
ncbi:hypothetical protein AAFJ72_16105 [Brevibacillus gelatini]